MTEFTINGRMHVKTLKANFKEAFGGSLRVYKSTHFADDDATLASVRNDSGVKAGEFICDGKMTVQDFETEMHKAFGIKVQVANATNSKLISNDMTLAESGKA